MMGGPDMAPTPPHARAAPAWPWRLSMTSPWGPRQAPTPPNARRAPAEPWRASTTRVNGRRPDYRSSLLISRKASVSELPRSWKTTVSVEVITAPA